MSGAIGQAVVTDTGFDKDISEKKGINAVQPERYLKKDTRSWWDSGAA